MSLAKRAVEGEAELLVRGVSSQPAHARADFSVAANGTIAWRPGVEALADVVCFDRQGKATGTAGSAAAIQSVFTSPVDDARLLVSGLSDWLVSVGDAGHATLERQVEWKAWSPDGRRVIGRRDDGLVERNVDGGQIERIGQVAPGVGVVWGLSTDRQFVIGRVQGRVAWARVPDMGRLAAWTPVNENDESSVDGSFSPDGRYVLYDATGGIFAQPFSGSGRRTRLASSGQDPVWRGDGKEILFTHDGAVWSITVSASAGSTAFSEPQKLFDGVRPAPASVQQSRGLAVSKDGTRIYLVQAVAQPAGDVIHVMTSQ